MNDTTQALKPTRRTTLLPAPFPGVIFGAISEGAVLFATETEVYFGLNEVGVKVWGLLPPVCRTLDELCEAIVREYPDAPAEVVRADVEELLADLVANGLAVSPPAGVRDERTDSSAA
ncbi:MAG: PqqD family protein [Gemmatimonadaceae bacterium]